MAVVRCEWATKTEIEQTYHDEVWGRPLHDEQQLFKMLLLEGQQAGLSWVTILRKWDALSAAFDDFEAEKIASYGETKQAELLANSQIIRNRLKIAAATKNAQAYLQMREAGLSLDTYLWEYVSGEPIVNNFRSLAEIPAFTPLSETISKDLKKRGFTFVGPTIIYAYLQSIGVVNDHIVDCAYRTN